jgi:hypothetical protein
LFPEAGTLLQRHRCQLLLWKRIIGKVLEDAAPEDWLQVGLDRLLQEDSHLVAINAMNVQARAREEGFLRNSIRGFIGYLQETPGQWRLERLKTILVASGIGFRFCQAARQPAMRRMSACRKQSSVWSFTMPIACIRA